MKSGRFDRRSFTALGALLSGLALPASGLADHVAGHSPGLDGGQGWALAHTASGVLFIAFCGSHVVLNRRALARYLRDLPVVGALPTREGLAAAALVGGVLAAAVAHALLEG